MPVNKIDNPEYFSAVPNWITLRLLSSSIFSTLACSLLLSCSSSLTLFCSFMNRLMSMAAFSNPISCTDRSVIFTGWGHLSLVISHSLTHLHLLNGVLGVSNLWCGEGWVVGIRPDTALIGRGPPMAWCELEKNQRETALCQIVYVLRKKIFYAWNLCHFILIMVYTAQLHISNHGVIWGRNQVDNFSEVIYFVRLKCESTYDQNYFNLNTKWVIKCFSVVERRGHLGQGHFLLQVVISLLQSGKFF